MPDGLPGAGGLKRDLSDLLRTRLLKGLWERSYFLEKKGATRSDLPLFSGPMPPTGTTATSDEEAVDSMIRMVEKEGPGFRP